MWPKNKNQPSCFWVLQMFAGLNQFQKAVIPQRLIKYICDNLQMKAECLHILICVCFLVIVYYCGITNATKQNLCEYT